MTAFVYRSTSGLFDCMIINSFLQQVMLYKGDYCSKRRSSSHYYHNTKSTILAIQREKKKKKTWI